MVRLLNRCKNILLSRRIHFSITLNNLVISNYSDYDQSINSPSLVINADTELYNFIYTENWDDGKLYRSKDEKIRCGINSAERALNEQLNRLKAPSLPNQRNGADRKKPGGSRKRPC